MSRPLGIVLGIAACALLALLFFLFSGSGRARDRSPLAYDGLISFLEKRGTTSETSRRPPDRDDRDLYARVLIEPLVSVNARRERGRLSWGDYRRKLDTVPTIVVFPKWLRFSDGSVTRQRVHNQYDLFRATRGALNLNFARTFRANFEKLEDESQSPYILAPQGVVTQRDDLPEGFEPLVTNGRYILAGRILRQKMPDMLVIFDPDLVNNHGLANSDHADLMLPVIEEFIGERTLFIDQSSWEPAEREERTQAPPARNRDLPRLLSFPFAYLWIAFGLLAALAAWAFVGRSEGISAGPQGLQPPPSLNRRLTRLARLWNRNLSTDEISQLYEDALIDQSAHRLGIKGDGPAKRAGLAALETARRQTSELEDLFSLSSAGLDPMTRLQILRRNLRDL